MTLVDAAPFNGPVTLALRERGDAYVQNADVQTQVLGSELAAKLFIVVDGAEAASVAEEVVELGAQAV